MNLILEKIKSKFPIILLSLAVIFCLAYSIPNLTTKPKLWIDEGISIEIARNFSHAGVLDVRISPESFSGIPYLLQATGYPVTVPLAIAFKIFGFSATVARAYMVVWMIVMIVAVFLFTKKYFGELEAGLASVLVSSFASFYGTGRSVMGEIPGFTFLLLGIHMWLSKKYYWSGFFVLLCLVSKPSVYILVLPAFLAGFLYTKGEIKSVPKAALFGLIPFATWFYFNVTDLFDKSVWIKLGSFYKNPFFGQSMSANFIKNFYGLFTSTTIIYFVILISLILISWYLMRKSFSKEILFIHAFFSTYSLFALFYYLRSPGYLRYILAAEFFTLMILPFALKNLATYFSNRFDFSLVKLVPVGICALSLFQVWQMLFISNLYFGTAALDLASYVDRKYPDKSVLALNLIEASSLLKTNKRFNLVEDIGTDAFGNENVLDEKNKPEVLIANTKRSRFYEKNKEKILKYYSFDQKVAGSDVYSLKKHE
jgi:hypothetical protein